MAVKEFCFLLIVACAGAVTNNTLSVSSTDLSATKTFYLDIYSTCNGVTHFNSDSEGAIIKAWSGHPHITSFTSCTLTFFSYGGNVLKFKFNSNSKILDDSVILDIYQRGYVTGIPKVSIAIIM